MNTKYFFAMFSVIAVLLSACAPSYYGFGSPNPSSLSLGRKADVGEYLVAGNGFTLYTFAQDTNGSSTCNGDCTTKWPPLLQGSSLPTGVGGSLGMVARADGQRQVTYDGKPLYFFAGDKTSGDTNGHGVGSVWFAAKPSLLESVSNANNNQSSDSNNSY